MSDDTRPAADSPAADSPAADSPAADRPAVDRPAADRPAADRPAADRPAAVIAPECRERFLQPASEGLGLLVERGVGFSGTSELRARYEIRRRGYSSHLLLYTLGGSGWLRTARESAILRPGTVWIAPAGVAHEYGLRSKAWNILWISLAARAPWSAVSEAGMCIRSSQWGEELKRAMDGLLRERRVKAPRGATAAQLYSELLLLNIERELSLSESPQDREIRLRLEQLQELLKGRLHEEWTVRRLASVSGLFVSADHFARTCVRHVGSPPLAMLTRLRMERAGELLRHSGYSVKQIAQSVGYGSAFAFSTAFKRYAGHSPSRHRSQR